MPLTHSTSSQRRLQNLQLRLGIKGLALYHCRSDSGFDAMIALNRG
jgi:hypothetical protein